MASITNFPVFAKSSLPALALQELAELVQNEDLVQAKTSEADLQTLRQTLSTEWTDGVIDPRFFKFANDPVSLFETLLLNLRLKRVQLTIMGSVQADFIHILDACGVYCSHIQFSHGDLNCQCRLAVAHDCVKNAHVVYFSRVMLPYGLIWSIAEIEELCQQHTQCLFIVDERGIDYTIETSVLPLALKYGNILPMRDLSFYGMQSTQLSVVVVTPQLNWPVFMSNHDPLSDRRVSPWNIKVATIVMKHYGHFRAKAAQCRERFDRIRAAMIASKFNSEIVFDIGPKAYLYGGIQIEEIKTGRSGHLFDAESLRPRIHDIIELTVQSDDDEKALLQALTGFHAQRVVPLLPHDECSSFKHFGFQTLGRLLDNMKALCINTWIDGTALVSARKLHMFTGMEFPVEIGALVEDGIMASLVDLCAPVECTRENGYYTLDFYRQVTWNMNLHWTFRIVPFYMEYRKLSPPRADAMESSSSSSIVDLPHGCSLINKSRVPRDQSSMIVRSYEWDTIFPVVSDVLRGCISDETIVIPLPNKSDKMVQQYLEANGQILIQ